MPRRKDSRACGVFMFGADWRAEPTLMLCGEGARLLWFEMLLLMAESERRGFLLINGKRPSPAQIAALTRTDPAKARERLEELESNGVFSRDGSGAIYSRKMVRDVKNRANGALGGNPSLGNHRGNGKSDNPDGDNGLTRAPPKKGEKTENGAPAKPLPAKRNPASVKPLTPSSNTSPNGDDGGAVAGSDEKTTMALLFQRARQLLGESGGSFVGMARKAGYKAGEVFDLLVRLEGVAPEERAAFAAQAIRFRADGVAAACGRAAGPPRPSGDEPRFVESRARREARKAGLRESSDEFDRFVAERVRAVA